MLSHRFSTQIADNICVKTKQLQAKSTELFGNHDEWVTSVCECDVSRTAPLGLRRRSTPSQVRAHGADERSLVIAASIPDDDDFSAQSPQQGPQKTRYGGGINAVLGVRVEAQAQAAALRSHAEDRDDRDLVPVAIPRPA